MKKILYFTALFLTLALALGFFGFAVAVGGGNSQSDQSIDIQHQGLRPSGCCQLKHAIKVMGESGQEYVKGDYVGVPVPTGDTDAKMYNCPAHNGVYNSEPHWAGLCTIDGVMTFSEWIMWIAMIITTVAIVYAGIMYMTAGGVPARIQKAHQIFYWSLIGILVAVGARLIPSVIRYFVGV